MMNNKVVVLDWGIFIHKAIFALPNNPTIPATFTCVNMMISSLYRVGLDPDDIVIVAVDGRNSWRKDFEKAYKGDRKAKREASGIDFNYWYEEFNKLHERLNRGLDWHFIKIDRLEADDIMAVTCRFYNDREVILVTHDADLQQCWEYPHVKIFSTMTKKWKVKPHNFDLNRLQSEKIYKETTDNMVTPILTEEDFNVRKMCVDLIQLPEWVESAIIDELKKVGPKELDVQAVPFKSLQFKLANVYNDDSKVISYEGQIAREEAEEAREKRKKIEAKEKIKRTKVREEKKVEKQKLTEAKLLARIKKLEKKEAVENIKSKLKVKKENHNDTVYQGSRTEKHVEAENRREGNVGLLS